MASCWLLTKQVSSNSCIAPSWSGLADETNKLGFRDGGEAHSGQGLLKSENYRMTIDVSPLSPFCPLRHQSLHKCGAVCHAAFHMSDQPKLRQDGDSISGNNHVAHLAFCHLLFEAEL